MRAAGRIRRDPAEDLPGETLGPPSASVGREGKRTSGAASPPEGLLILLALLLLAGCAAAPAPLAGDPAASWPGRCEILRGNLLQEPAAGVVLSPRPERFESGPFWVLAVDGVSIPVPPVRYRDIRVLPSPFPGGLPTVVLAGEEPPSAVAVMSMRPPEPYEDVFALAGERPTDEGRALTKRLFGGPLTHGRLLEIGYAGRAEDLTCRPERWETEIPLAVALILKTVGGGLEDVFAGVGSRRGWVTREAESRGVVRWQATLPGDAQWVQVSIRAAADGPFRDAGLAVGQADTVRAAGRPPWLSALAAVLDDPSNGTLWSILADTLARAGFPGPSVERIRRSAPGPRR